MNQHVEQALLLWGWEGAHYTLIAARENAVYRIETADGPKALRVHRQGYRTDAELWSELLWMAHLSKGRLSVPEPIPSKDGSVLQTCNGVQIDALTWLNGPTMEEALPARNRPALFHSLGQKMAQLHDLSDTWVIPNAFRRCHWDRAGIVGETPLWGRFWENPALSYQDRALFTEFRNRANAELITLESSLDTGLIHADLVPANVLVDGTDLHIIDFDDGGYGFRLFEVATGLLKHRTAHDYEDLQDALIAGYTTIRPLDVRHLGLFLALRAATYVGWNITRMGEDTSGSRNARFISVARDLIGQYVIK